MKSSNQSELAGLGAIERTRLAQAIRATQATISVAEAAMVWQMEPQQAAKQLAKLAKKGWLTRVKQGIYLPIAITATTADSVAEDPFAIAEKLFSPCYIGGMNAANYWDLTEQLFQSITVMTKNKIRDRNPIFAGQKYRIHTIKSDYFFGVKIIWSNSLKIKISDPTKTIVDMLIFPQFCGGMNFIKEVFSNYYQSQYKNIELLIEYLQRANNGAAIKRAGFLAEKLFPDEKLLIDFCLDNLTQGYVKLSPSLDCPKIISRWRLKLPEN